MHSKSLIQCLPFVLVGIYLIIQGLTAKSLINESDFPASLEEKEGAKATPLRRLLVIAVGLASTVYGIMCLRH